MARGEFLQGLSEGIFERLGGLRQEQQARDDQQKSQVIQMLAGLADKIEPEGLPMLMGHMWDTMGIKKQASGKGLRGFLDAFSGMPNRSVEDQLGTKFREITSGMVGSETAKQARESYKQNLLQPYRETGTRPRSVEALPYKTPPELAGKMVFRDPRAEKLEEIESRYGAQLQHSLLLQQQRHEDALKRQDEANTAKANAKNLEYERKQNLDIDKVASIFKGSQDVQQFPEDQQDYVARVFAQRYLAGTLEGKLGNLNASITLKEALAGRAKNESPSSRVSRDRFIASQQKERRTLEQGVSDAKTVIDTLTPQLEDIGKTLDTSLKGKTRKDILASPLFAPTSPHMGPTKKAADLYRTMEGKLNKAKADLQLKQQQLLDFDTQGKKFVQPPPRAKRKKVGFTPSGLVPSIGSSGSSNMVNPPSGQIFDATTPVTNPMPGNWVRSRKEQIESRGHKTGDVINIGPKKYKVGELKGDWYQLSPVQ